MTLQQMMSCHSEPEEWWHYLVSQTKEYACFNCYVCTHPTIATSYRANRGPYCVPTAAAKRRGELAFFFAPAERAFDSRSDWWHWRSCECPHPRLTPPLNFPNFLGLCAAPIFVLPPDTPCTWLPPSLPCGHLNCPCQELEASLYLLLLRPTSSPAASAMHLLSAGLDDLYSWSGSVQP